MNNVSYMVSIFDIITNQNNIISNDTNDITGLLSNYGIERILIMNNLFMPLANSAVIDLTYSVSNNKTKLFNSAIAEGNLVKIEEVFNNSYKTVFVGYIATVNIGQDTQIGLNLTLNCLSLLGQLSYQLVANDIDDNWINGFVNYNAGIGCTYGFMIPSNISFYTNGGNFDIGVYSGNQLCRITGGATGLFSYNNTWNQGTLSSSQKALAQEKYYLDIYNTMQKEYKNFKYLIHDDDKLQKYFVVIDDGTGKLVVRKLDLTNKTDEKYLTYINFNLIALIDYAKQNYSILDKQISDLQEIVMNNQKISVIDANQIIYDNEIFIENYLAKG